MQLNIIFWSGTGNTEAMAKLIQKGAEESGATVVFKEVSKASKDDLNCDVLVLGCPSMGDEVLEEEDFEPFIASIEGEVKGEKLALFGSYGWGDGQWMRDWEERMKNAGAELVADCLIVNNEPSGDAEAQCVDFGKAIAK